MEERVVWADCSRMADGRRERCQRASCAEKARQLAAEQKAHRATQLALQTERTTRAILVRGEVRAALIGCDSPASKNERKKVTSALRVPVPSRSCVDPAPAAPSL